MNLVDNDVTVQVLFGKKMSTSEGIQLLKKHFPLKFKLYWDRFDTEAQEFVQNWDDHDLGIWFLDDHNVSRKNQHVIVGIELDTVNLKMSSDGDYSHIQHKFDLKCLSKLQNIVGELSLFSGATVWK
jgi:hypothetical protein